MLWFPYFVSYDIADYSLAHIVHRPKRFLANTSTTVAFTNRPNCGPCKFGPRMFFSSDYWRRRPPSFSYRIMTVFFNCSSIKVGWIYTSRVIALVHNNLSVRNITVMKEPAYAMRPKVCATSGAFANLSVTIPKETTNPLPALSKLWAMFRNRSILVNLTPEAFLERLGKALLEKFTDARFFLHSFSLVDCLPRLRLFVQRAGTFLVSVIASHIATTQ